MCRALAFDTERRISNFTHQDGKSAKDHCIRTEHVSFKCLGQEVAAGPLLRKFLNRHKLQPDAVASATLLFLPQKEKGMTTVSPCIPVVLERRTQDESTVLSQLISWVLHTENGPQEELFTRREETED
jgi:hypothetical protein